MTDPKPPFTEALVEIVARAMQADDSDFRDEWADIPEYKREYWLSMARAALRALTDSGSVILPREPSNEMKTAAFMWWLDNCENDRGYNDARTISLYRAMRDAAMGGKG